MRLFVPTQKGSTARWSALILLVTLGPALAAVWWGPWFIAQDQAAHVYNARLLNLSLQPNSPLAKVFQMRWAPLPNWAGHLSLMGLLTFLPERHADRLMTSLTLVGFLGSILWLRWRLAGWTGMPIAVLLAVLLALNVTWIFGFTSFLLGACLFPVTLGLWWTGRERPRLPWALLLAALLLITYFCHLVSVGLSVVAILFLAAIAPTSARMRCLLWTSASIAPLLPLAIVYLRMVPGGGSWEPKWNPIEDPSLLRAWWSYLGECNPISLARGNRLPFSQGQFPWARGLSPVVWLGLGLGLLLSRSAFHGSCASGGIRPGTHPLVVLAFVLLLSGFLAPNCFGKDDTVQSGHGGFLAPRVILVGLVVLVPALRLDASGWRGRLACTCLGIAVAGQVLSVWDYGLVSNRMVGKFMRARAFIHQGERVGAFLLDTSSPFRVNPLISCPALLGVYGNNIVWNNYETKHYYFPVHYRPGFVYPPASAFAAVTSAQVDPSWMVGCYNQVLEHYHDQIDVLLVWGSELRLNRANAQRYRCVYHREKLWELEHVPPARDTKGEKLLVATDKP
jgi:hypothetical protein